MSEKKIFSSALLLSILGGLSCAFFYLAKTLVLGEFTPAQFPLLNLISGPFYVILALGLFLGSRRHSFSSVFSGTLYALSGLLTLSTVLLLVQDSLTFHGAAELLDPAYAPLLKNWVGTLFYVSASLISMQLLLLFVWGYVNQFMTFSQGIKYYLPAAFVLGLPGTLIPLATGVFQYLLQVSPFILGFLGVGMLDAMLLYFRWNYQQLAGKEVEAKEVAAQKFPSISSAYLIAAPILAYTLFNFFLKVDLRTQIPDFTHYAEWMARYSSCLGASLLTLSLVWIAIGMWLLREKTWEKVALFGAGTVLSVGFVYLGYSLTSQNPSWLFQGLFSGLLRSTSSALFFPLIQLLYLKLPTETRFYKKVVTELLFLPLMKGAPALLLQASLMAFGSLSTLAFPLKALALFLLGLLILAVQRIGKFQVSR